MRKDVWQRVGEPILSNQVVNMQSVHKTSEMTCGVLQDFPITIGPCTFYLQIHVTETLPCEVLIGQPFFNLTRAKAITYEDGTQDLVLFDPNTGTEITLPTKERKKHSDF